MPVLDGDLTDWLGSDRIDDNSSAGYQIYATSNANDFIFALVAPTEIGANTTAWFNTDRIASTGYQIFGFAGGAEYNVNFAADGTISLYSGGAGETLVLGNLAAAWSADRTIVEFSVPKTALGNPNAIDTLYDINDSVFLPSNYSGTPFTLFNDTGIVPSADTRIAIVYSETTANAFFSDMAYSHLFMSVQSQAMQAGITFDILTEADLTNLSKLAEYDALVFPSFRNVEASQAEAIANTLQQATTQFGVGLIAAGEFMTNAADNSPLPGNSYARMSLLFDVTRVTGGNDADVSIRATDASGLIFDGYANGEVVREYQGVGWNAFTSVSGTGVTLATETINGQDYAAVLATQTGGRNILFSGEGVMADANLLQKAIDYVVSGTSVSVGLQLTRQSGLVASRVDMDQSQEQYEVNPDDGSPGIYDQLLPILTSWKQTYNFVGSYYVNVGNNPGQGQMTDWSVSLPVYKALLDLGNEIGSHSYTHPDNTNTLTASQIEFEFGQSTAVLEQQLSNYLGRTFDILGAAEPGAPDTLATAKAILPYVSNYLTGGYAGQGAGYPNAFGYLTPDTAGKVYLAPNAVFDFTLFEFQNKTPSEAEAAWAAEWNMLTSRGETPIVVWPFHDYGAAMWDSEGVSPYVTDVYTNWIARAAAADMEFVTLADLSARITAFDAATVTATIAGNIITASVTGSRLGQFALDVDGQGSQLIQSVTGWYAYDNDSIYLPRDGGTFTITLGAVQDDVTHIIDLGMRSSLLSLTGDGQNLSFAVEGEGTVVIDLANPGNNRVNVTGASIVSRVGEMLTLDLGGFGMHNVVLTYTAPSAPLITSNGGGDTGAVSRPENGTTVTTVVAIEADSYSILSGGDGALFTIDPLTGALAFAAAPDFEAPADADRNNVYMVTVGATNIYGTDTQQLAITVTNVLGVTQTTPTAGGTLNGTIEADTLSGRTGPDTLNGLGGNDSLKGNAGNDTLDGGVGDDRLDGGDHNDILIGGDGVDNLLGSAGNDTLDGGNGQDKLDGGVGDDTLTGGAGNDTLWSGAGNDNLDGGDGVDTFDAGAGNDTLNGGIGNDRLYGGLGTDRMTGGAGADIFEFYKTTESTVSPTLRDVILDFEHAIDRLDVSNIDANTGQGGNQTFVFLPTPGAAFTGAGQISFRYEFIGGVEYTIVDANVNANLLADFQIALLGHHNLTSSDFFL